MKVSFVTRKIYSDNTEKIAVKNGYEINIEKAMETKRKNKINKEIDLENIKSILQLTVALSLKGQ
ncbi:hypothetical protein EOM82_05270 [bacterium]|nr:hypothetical protein [bacterium]